ncbi:T9SS type A sorting domain-containing protein [Winogradskyella ouciana]|uniref:T9SS type A sorting domain-containing protein n=1 Tax=Winogradskyella ouciana TaxID=2608631 RepID=A0A7K1GE06_9FLAO|nr:T9SS type A sorting domain-containing protein [Winogradskyella ouciana]MTE27331.1 T9SS type A sorting domain-containing protein [Winogradskyella ouciana]
MKNYILWPFILTLFCSNILLSQTTAIPDFVFEDYLETHNEDGEIVSVGDSASLGDGIANNGLVFTDRIDAIVSLNIDGIGVSDLAGIEDFLALETLICSNNDLAAVDISNNTSLVSFLCGSNFLSNIDVSNNLNLESLNCSDNQIESLDVSNNSALKSLTASNNQLQNIDVSNNIELTILSVSNNRIVGELVVSNNANLEGLFCSSNQISVLNLTTNTLLRNLDVSDNGLTSLDLSTINSVVCPDPQTDPVTVCQGTSTINVSRNQLTSLIVANDFNNLISIFDASENPDLFCIQIDSGFTPNSWIKDDWAYYSDTTCVDIYTYVPDDNFEQALINLGYDDILDNLVLTANIDTILDLNISNASISNLIGIEDFTALEVLDVSNNNLASADLSSNLVLQELYATNNNLTGLDLNSNTALVTVDCSGNNLDDLDVSANSNLTTLNCSNNTLISLDVSNNLMLTDLDCSMNQIEFLDITNNSVLTGLACNNNNLFALNLNNGNNTAITAFDATNNANLFCIEVDDVAFANGAAGWQKDAIASYDLNCGTYIPDDNFEQALIDQGIDSDGTLNNFVPTADINTLIALDVSSLDIADLTGIQDFVALQDLNVSNNMLISLDLGNNTALEILDCSINQIESLDLTANASLTSVLCNYNALQTLNIENGNNASLTVFNTTDNPNLFCINVDDAIVGTIPGSWQKDTFTAYNGDCANNRFTAIPDAIFEQALIDLGYDDIIDAQVLTANIEHVQNLNVSDQSISDLTGIRDFKSLIEIDCSGNFLEALDVSDMIYLERLNCSSNYLLTNDINNTNGLLNTTGTISLTELYCAGNNLADLDTSLNTNLEVLDCADNNLDVLNVSGNTMLKELNCSNNNLTALNVSNNAVLEGLNCNSNALNNLTTSTVSNNTLVSLSCVSNNLPSLLVNNYVALTTLNCGSNELTQLNITNNSALELLSITNNQISTINLTNNVSLVEAQLSQNSLTELDVNANAQLEYLSCSFNELTELNLAANTVLQSLSCASNQLTNLDLSSSINLIEANFNSNSIANLTLSTNLSLLKKLDASNNLIEGDIDLTTMAISACVYDVNQTEFCPESITINLSNNLFDFVNIQNGINSDIANFNVSSNPNLECVQVDDVDNVPVNWIKDETTAYNIDCNFGETYVPDDNFEQALINLGYDSGPLNDYVLTVNIEALTDLDISGNNIANLTGIEDFLALENLNCSNNTITELDLSSNINLLNIDCSGNQLTGLDVTSNISLTTINCSANVISTIDLSNNINLSVLDISNNTFTSFLPSDVLSLQVFNCENNEIVELDFQQNQSLTSISCQSNFLDTLNIRNGQNAILTDLNAQINPDLTCVETDTGAVPSGATWLVDATAQFAIECFFGETYVPDDNFEQALIDFGYDSGPLDDYVFTENIEDIGFLDVSGRDITDLTGIEGFISLTNLNFEDNNVAVLDISTNVLLTNLDASNNIFSDLNVSNQPDLIDLDVSGNNLTELNLDNNLNLVDINVSSNMLTSLNVGLFSNLEELNCASNQLSSIDVSQNPNLTLLFCQSNILIGDQLNLQNGNNENLELFNATNNPDLGCILVDDPVAVINNTDGLYDNWFKDETSSYQAICEDADNDGVPNVDDLCPGTEFGATVDLFGCAVIDLPIDNFTISITGETCLNSNNGKISIEALEVYTYTATLVGEGFNESYNFFDDVDIFNLLAGTYEICITIAEWPDYESCYTIVITEPNPLEVFASRMASGDKVALDMYGNTSFNVEFNGEIFTTHNANLELQLQQGENILKVTTDLECQGSFEKRIFFGNHFLVYPNPFENQFYVFNGLENDDISVEIYSTFGQLVLSKNLKNNGTEMKVDTNQLTSGLYVVKVKSKSNTSSCKIIKK